MQTGRRALQGAGGGAGRGRAPPTQGGRAGPWQQRQVLQRLRRAPYLVLLVQGSILSVPGRMTMSVVRNRKSG